MRIEVLLTRRPPAVVVAATLVALALAGCELQGPEKDLVRTDLDITFRVAEITAEEGAAPSLRLSMASKKQLGCGNYHLENRFERDGRMIDVRVLGASIGDVCLTTVGPASAQRRLELPPGTYRLRFDHGNVTDEYRLHVNEKAVRVETISASKSEPEASVFWRYPERSFGFSCHVVKKDEAVCAEFTARLEEKLKLEPLDVPENGAWPYRRILRKGKRDLDYRYYAPPRFYTYEKGAFQQAGALLREFARTALDTASGHDLTLRNWRGKDFRSVYMDDD